MAEMHSEMVQRATEGNNVSRLKSESKCGVSSDYEDSKIPAAVATLGVIVAAACVGFWPRDAVLGCVVPSLTAGLLVLPLMLAVCPHLAGGRCH